MMSSFPNSKYQEMKYQTQTRTSTYLNKSMIPFGQNSNKNSIIEPRNCNYVYQDNIPDNNVVHYNSNMRKFRTRSSNKNYNTNTCQKLSNFQKNIMQNWRSNKGRQTFTANTTNKRIYSVDNKLINERRLINDDKFCTCNNCDNFQNENRKSTAPIALSNSIRNSDNKIGINSNAQRINKDNKNALTNSMDDKRISLNRNIGNANTSNTSNNRRSQIYTSSDKAFNLANDKNGDNKNNIQYGRRGNYVDGYKLNENRKKDEMNNLRNNNRSLKPYTAQKNGESEQKRRNPANVQNNEITEFGRRNGRKNEKDNNIRNPRINEGTKNEIEGRRGKSVEKQNDINNKIGDNNLNNIGKNMGQNDNRQSLKYNDNDIEDNKKNKSNYKTKNGIENSEKVKKFEENSSKVKEIGGLNFDGLFMDISKYENQQRKKNPFIGPSPFYKVYEERMIKIREKICQNEGEKKNEKVEG